MGFMQKTPIQKLLWKRVCAFFLDISFFGFIKISFISSYMVFMRKYFTHLPGTAKIEILDSLGRLELPLTLTLFFGYFFTSLWLTNGRTFGKWVMGLRTIPNQFKNQPFKKNLIWNYQTLLTRTLGYFVCYLSGMSLFAINFFRADTKGVADLISSSTTLEEEVINKILVESQRNNLWYIEAEVNDISSYKESA